MSVRFTQVARTVPFDNSTNGFVAIEVQSAIEEARATVLNSYLTSTSTVSSTSATFATIADMTITPTAGTWVGIFTGNFRTTGVNTNAEIAAFIGGVQLAETTRQQEDNTAILGLVTLSTNEGASSASLVFKQVLNGSQQVTIRFRRVSGGTAFVDNRTFILLQVAL